jgi:hypothetical protein
MPFGTYAKAVTMDKRLAQEAIAALFVGKAEEAAIGLAS